MLTAAPVSEVLRPDCVRLLDSETIGEALHRLRSGTLGERIIYFYVTDAAGLLRGVVPTRRLLLSPPERAVAEVMITPVTSVRDTAPLHEAVRMMTTRRLLALPVVNAHGILLGVVDIFAPGFDPVNVEHREAAEGLFQVAGIHVEQQTIRSWHGVLRARFPWLLCNVVSGLAGAFLVGGFGEMLQSAVALTFFIPVVLALAESVAMQSVALGLPALQAGVRAAGAGPAAEAKSGLILGAASGLLVAAISLVWLRRPALSSILILAIASSTCSGALLGYGVPRLVHRFRLNPKIASGPAALALADLFALVAYLGIGAWLL